jgi:hypothetical protein
VPLFGKGANPHLAHHMRSFRREHKFNQILPICLKAEQEMEASRQFASISFSWQTW